jgi:signal transduction histidine kinase
MVLLGLLGAAGAPPSAEPPPRDDIQNFDRVLIVRHFAICAGAAAAYVLRPELLGGRTVFVIMIVGAVLNFAAFEFRTRPKLARACRLASPVIGVGSWIALVAATSGVASPFIAGLWLEVVLSAVAPRGGGVVPVTIGAVMALWGQQLWLGIEGAGAALILQTGFLLGMGGATLLVSRRWLRDSEQLARGQMRLRERLDQLEQELADERVLAKTGERVARLAHGLKNAVHSLRGFVDLIEPRLQARKANAKVLAELRVAIEDLESLARLTLEPDPPESTSSPTGDTCRPQPTLERAIRTASISHPGVEWTMVTDGTDPRLAISSESLLEVLGTLIENGAQAMGGRGKGSLEARSIGHEFHLLVRDEGPGLPEDAISRIFSAGFTMKRGGSGYGLFLARRIVSQHGGSLTARPTGGIGAIFDLAFPLFHDERPGDRGSGQR